MDLKPIYTVDEVHDMYCPHIRDRAMRRAIEIHLRDTYGFDSLTPIERAFSYETMRTHYKQRVPEVLND